MSASSLAEEEEPKNASRKKVDTQINICLVKGLWADYFKSFLLSLSQIVQPIVNNLAVALLLWLWKGMMLLPLAV